MGDRLRLSLTTRVRGRLVNKYMVYGAFFLAGVVLAGKVKSLPGFSALPSL